MSETVVKSDLAICLGPFIEITNSAMSLVILCLFGSNGNWQILLVSINNSTSRLGKLAKSASQIVEHQEEGRRCLPSSLCAKAYKCAELVVLQLLSGEPQSYYSYNFAHAWQRW